MSASKSPAKRPRSSFTPPIVRKKSQGPSAFFAYNWYFAQMREKLGAAGRVFLTPCAATKPIHSSPLHRQIYQKVARAVAGNSEVLVVSEPVVLIRYSDLYDLEDCFMYDFPPKLLSPEARELFVRRLRLLLRDKRIEGCLPSHHARLINDAVGTDWKNYWRGDLYSMMEKASALARRLERQKHSA